MKLPPDLHLLAVLVVLAGVLSGLPQRAWSAEDSYLRALEAEASDTGAKNAAAAEPAPRQAGRADVVQDRETIRPDMDFQGFEAELHAAYPGTSFLYEKLGEPQRKAVSGG
jgi:hypothetical protein